ncbi:unnamed protein product [Medioppia subpectinata]|uniref:ABC transmembrane type-1 domain-containing protein n=1 Tax=Medioppia subpectinata TaxID=1979941 RepID=A0A7R9KLR1_9ACAR|nr:unnamed protein product [Medioppia subpectinata]CAG2105945.1 unnamed protein product [Medioppia subpectinata]
MCIEVLIVIILEMHNTLTTVLLALSLDQLLATLENTNLCNYFVSNFTEMCPQFTSFVQILAVFVDRIRFYDLFAKTMANTRVNSLLQIYHKITFAVNNYRSKCPKTGASFISRLTFSWFTPIIMNGYRKPLTDEDMWPLEVDNEAKSCVQQFNKHRHQLNENKTKAPVNILPTILLTHGPSLALNSVTKLVSTLLTLSQPVILDRLITFLTASGQTLAEPDWIGYTYALLLFVCPVLASVLNAQHNYWSNVIGLRIRTSITAILYEKSIKLSSSGRKDNTSGELLKMLSTDMHYIMFFVPYYDNLWISPLKLLVSIWLLWAQLGAASLPGVIFILVIVPINTYMNAIQGRLWAELGKHTASRVSAITEILNHIKVLKLYAWEQCFIDKVLALRDRELGVLTRIIKLTTWNAFMHNSCGIVVSILSFTTFTLISDHNILDPNKAWTIPNYSSLFGNRAKGVNNF